MFLKGSGAADLQGESEDLVWSLDPKTAFLVHFSPFHSRLLATFHLFPLPKGPLTLSLSRPRMKGGGLRRLMPQTPETLGGHDCPFLCCS